MLQADPVLGAVIGNYPSDRARLLIPAALVCGIAAVVLNFTLAEVPDSGPPLTILIMGLVTMAMGWRVLHFWNREIVVYEHGFSYREGSATVYFMYAEIISIRQRGERLAYFGGLFRRTVYRFTLTTIRGEKMVLSNLYRRVEQLIEQIEQKVYPLLEAYIADRLAKGEKVAFGDDLRLSSAGLHAPPGELPWSQLENFKVGGGRLSLIARPDKAEWLSLPLSEIDNIPLLLKLLRGRGRVG